MFAWLQTPAVTPLFSLWCLFMVILMLSTALVPQMVKNPSANAGDPGLIPGSGKSQEEGMATHSSVLAWRIPWTEDPGGLQSMGSQRVRHD